MVMSPGIIEKIREELNERVDEEYKKNNQKYFKEKIKCYG